MTAPTEPATRGRTRPSTARRVRRARARGGRGLLYAFLVSLVVVFVLPMVWALSSSFKTRGDIFAYPPELVPPAPTLDNYARLLDGQPFTNWLFTSVLVATISTVASLLLCSLAGFGFAKYDFRGKGALFNIMFSSLAVPIVVIMVPLFIMLAKAQLTHPYFALVVPWVAPAFGIFMMRQFTEQSVPSALLDAARADGCTEFGLFWRVVLPLLRPALGALGVWSFLNSYNNFLWPLIVVSDPAYYTLPLGIQTLFGAQGRQYDLVLAASVLAVIPGLLFFLLLRRQLMAGLTVGAVKG